MPRSSASALLAAGLLVASAGVEAGDLASYTIVQKDYSIPESLTDQPGDPVNGRAVAINRKKGNCLACHEMPIPEESFHGRVAPPLDGVGSRYDTAQLRLRVVNPKALNPMSLMPAFYKVDGLVSVKEEFEGEPILTAQEIEDVVAYLATLK